jgi:serine/threonine protein kinase
VQLFKKIDDPKNERLYLLMEVSYASENHEREAHTTQYCNSGDLGGFLRKAERNKRPLEEDKIWNIFTQITLALHHCHYPDDRASQPARNGVPRQSVPTALRHQVLHRDLKPDNSRKFVSWAEPAADRTQFSCPMILSNWVILDSARTWAMRPLPALMLE